MSDRNLKYNGTPLNHFKTPSSRRRMDKGVKREMSDSEESVTSNPDSDIMLISGKGGITNELSLVAEFDELIRLVKNRRVDTLEDSNLDLAIQVQKICETWQIANDECQRLLLELDKKTHEFSDLENKLAIARKLLDQEKRNTRKVEDERDLYMTQIVQVRDVLFRDGRNRIPDETREKLKFLNFNRKSYDDILMSPPLTAIREGNTTGSLLSDFSYSMSEDDLDGTALKYGKSWKKRRPSMDGPIGEPATKKRRSSANKVVEINNTETVRATTTLTLSKKGGPIKATSVIESVPQHQREESDGLRTPTFQKMGVPQHVNLICDMWQNPSPQQNQYTPTPKQHTFQSKTVVMPDTCGPCNKRIRFGKTALKCRNCRAVCHPECKDNLPVPCIPCANTPTQRNMSGVIADYTPTTPPMVPAMIVHCLKEIEAKGLSELGIYRIPGAERDVKCLKEKFLKGRGAPCLNQVDVHVICGSVKDFLRSLSEPLITYALWGDFVKAVENQNMQDMVPTLCQIVAELPQPNRDTLAYMILHLRRVAEAKECKMPISNLAKVFGPTIVGYSSADPDPSNLITETRQQVAVMEQLINLPLEYWQNFIVQQKLGTMRLQQTPSTDSLLRPTTGRGFVTPQIGRNSEKKKKKLLRTPPGFYNKI